MKKLMILLFLSCFKATELIEKRFHFKLSFQEKIQLKMHTSMCDVCTMYEKQSSLLNDALCHPEKWKNNEEDLSEFKRLLIDRLKEN